MSAVLVAALVIVIPVVVVMVIVGALRRRDDAVKREALSPAVGTLRYQVPEGQDPATVLAALEKEGYAATMSPTPASHEVLIPCRSGADRERAHVRAVISQAALTMEGGDLGDHPVVFVDERGRAGA